MKVIFRLETDGGEEISSLVLPIEQRDYLLLSPEALSAQYITPYLENLQTFVLPQEGAFGPA